ncbi:MAG: class I SAM-dependent methyltransferase [Ornithinimicrobium sp.]|uniref:class I SAM-dependent methyltransferase n=1 Tax=Ornithinimicrobium sp. TaxID=1977084 RepID=UPI0026DF2144|nr:class I SAM-dependent methyltransferase [Ornithinimicrobium sp.]MDO5738921.1 class I SAM-dependent methyltransferase [Ornithinimicrobium sp.]
MTDYDQFAQAYSAANENNLLNAWYERPAMVELAGDVDGRRVLDAGCGSGPLSADLRDRGALVSGFDLSPAMVALARERLGAEVDLKVADLAERLPYEDDSFDVVVCSLALHYLKDWVAPLTELRRVLRPGGHLVVSVPHPAAYLFNYQGSDYFALTQYSEEFEFGEQHAVLTYWHRPLHAITDAFTEAGWRISVVSEPSWSPDTPAELLPANAGERTAFVCFLFFALHAL